MNRYTNLITKLIASTIPNMSASESTLTSKTSLSSSTTPANPSTITTYQEKNLTHAPNLAPLTTASKPIPTVEPLTIKVTSDTQHRRTTVPAFLHLSPFHSSTSPPSLAAILLSGASGGVVGPSSIYLSIADKLASLSSTIPVLRLDYRYPARNEPCIHDVRSGMDFLESAFGIARFVLVGWSFGGAPVFSTAAIDKRVVACATVASQTAETSGIRKLAPRPVLLLHGTGDRTLSPWCSQQLYEMYGEGKGERTLRLFEGDDHSLTRSSAEAEREICEFVVRIAGTGVSEGEMEVLGRSLVGEKEKVEIMRRAGEVDGEESVR